MWFYVADLQDNAVVANATVYGCIDGQYRTTVGEATLLMQMDPHATGFKSAFRVTVDGMELNPLDNTETGHSFRRHYELPMDNDWELVIQPSKSNNNGGRKVLLIRINFTPNKERNEGLSFVQLTIPIVKGNSKNARRWSDAVVYADQVRREERTAVI
ncbi:hypothetical protein SEMRO_16_G011560.1 [Seminavis robusta]|uniref:Uncharacterized protein n=1 Tax=Seminavis robusta TaxID=568900 RepID=A0A9N8H503_9STRA|nr:hypothetical protein SEMRO_16_G011560.1 [Seminavis robusta]|eukprot:Sro16_g011560.1 n/a (158) ;mRNA; f:29321-29794